MKNTVTLSSVTTVALLLSFATLFFPGSIQALELNVSSTGVISFYDDGVLGDSTEAILAQNAASRVIPSRAGNRVNLQATDRAVQVGVENRQESNTTPTTVRQVEQSEVQRLRARFPAQVTDVHLENLEADNELEERTEYQRHLLEQRRQRTDNVEVRSNLDEEGAQELEVRSKSAAARIRQAEFSIEPETNTVTITTPSGQERVLNHLPDQALERIRQRIELQNTEAGTPDFDIETNNDGELIYRTRGVKTKKFLGLFNRGVEAEVILNDETGEILEVEKPSPGILGQFLDAFSY